MKTADFDPQAFERLRGKCARAVVVAFAMPLVTWLALMLRIDDAMPRWIAAPPWPGVVVALGVAALVLAPVVERVRLGTRGFARYVAAKSSSFDLRTLVVVWGAVVSCVTGRLGWSFALAFAALVSMALAWPRASDFDVEAGIERPDAVEPR